MVSASSVLLITSREPRNEINKLYIPHCRHMQVSDVSMCTWKSFSFKPPHRASEGLGHSVNRGGEAEAQKGRPTNALELLCHRVSHSDGICWCARKVSVVNACQALYPHPGMCGSGF